MTLIFETNLSGHRLEYLQHLYHAAISDKKHKYVFVLPEQIRQYTSSSEWVNSDNIIIQTLSEEEIKYCSRGNLLISSLKRTLILRKYTHKYKATQIFLIFLMLYIPWGLLCLPKKVQISGIIYRIFLNQKSNFIKKNIHWGLYYLLTSSNRINKVFLLNDQHSAEILNNKLKTKKYICLPDPISTYDSSEIIDFRKKYDISSQQLLFAHFGGLTRRKGTIKILEAITKIPIEKKDLFCFFFAGKVYNDIKDEFYTRITDLKKKGYHIFSDDSFVSYNFLHSLAEASDAILLPYSNTQQSSGVLGYAALHQKPVIGSKEGLLGKLITHHNLGDTLNETSSDAIYNAIIRFRRKKIISNYTILNSVEKFSMTILP